MIDPASIIIINPYINQQQLQLEHFDQALRQIAEKKYAEEMRSQGVHAITQYGVAFSGKHVEISVSEE